MSQSRPSSTDLETWALWRQQKHLASRVVAIEASLDDSPPSALTADDVAEMSSAEMQSALRLLAAERDCLDTVERLIRRRLISLCSSH